MKYKNTFWQFLLPQHLLSRLVGTIARCKTPYIKNFLIKQFIKKYSIKMYDALEQDPNKYKSLEDFFIREVHPEARPFVCGAEDMACPVDGTISQLGQINGKELLQAKGYNFSVDSLFGGDSGLAKNFHDGCFTTIYLAPKNYHRVYMPIDGTLVKTIYIPGKLFSVNQKTTSEIKDIFTRNERLVMVFNTDIGLMSIVLVGAMIVSSIHTKWTDDLITNNFENEIKSNSHEGQGINIRRGEEIGYFTFGSTVILLFQKDKIRLNDSLLKVNKSVLIGQLLGTM